MPSLSQYIGVGKSLSSIHKQRGAMIGSDAAFQVKESQRKQAFESLQQINQIAGSFAQESKEASKLRNSKGLKNETIDRGLIQSGLDKVGNFIGLDNFGDILGIDYKGLSDEDVQFKYLEGKYNEAIGKSAVGETLSKTVGKSSAATTNFDQAQEDLVTIENKRTSYIRPEAY